MNNTIKQIYTLASRIFLIAIILTVVFFALRAAWKSPIFNSVESDEFVCTAHEAGKKYAYTVSYRGRSFLVGHKINDSYPIFDLENGDEIAQDDTHYEQIVKCIRMYHFRFDGFTGRSPAELRNGDLIVNPKKTNKQDTLETKESELNQKEQWLNFFKQN